MLERQEQWMRGKMPRNFFEAAGRCVYPRNPAHRTEFDGARGFAFGSS
jgi:hypothetical protein